MPCNARASSSKGRIFASPVPWRSLCNGLTPFPIPGLISRFVYLKIVDTSKFSQAEGSVQREIGALRMLEHDNCIRMRAYCRHKNDYYIILDLAKGEVVLDWLQRKQRCTEIEMAVIANGILQGVYYLHSKSMSRVFLLLSLCRSTRAIALKFS